MNPYYQDDFITLHHGDCLENPAPWISADVLVTDPPYGMGYESRRVPSRIGSPIAGDETTDARDKALGMWSNANRNKTAIIKPAIIFGRWNQPRPSHVAQRLIWSKAPDPGMGDLSSPWGNSDEEIYVIGKGFHGKRGANILSCPKPPVNNRPDHPTPKPVSLMEHLIERCPEGVIADPFAGSGSTLRAAKNLGRKVIGFELEEKYCEIIAQRLAQEVLFV